MKSKVVNLFNIDIDNVTLKESINIIDNRITENKRFNKYGYVVTPNVDHIVNIQKNKLFEKIYSDADLILADGAPIVFASKLLGNPLKEKVSGSDITPRLFELAQKRKYRVFIFGSMPGVAQNAIDKLQKKFKYNFPISSYSPPFGFEKDKNMLDRSIRCITDFQPDILLVSLGSPKGELFIYRYLNELKVPLSFQIGASIDFIAGRIKRAPSWMQKSGLEWFYRFLKEPKRLFKRYFINDSYFLFILLQEFLKKLISVR